MGFLKPRLLLLLILGTLFTVGSCSLIGAGDLTLQSGTGSPAGRVFSPSYLSYEAENGSYAGTLAGPGRNYHTVESEASGRKYVSLATTGNYVQWTASAAANGINIRYNMPDSAGGGGTTATLSLYVNGSKIQTLTLSSTYAWVYGDAVAGKVWYSNSPSAGSPHRFFDQSHFLLNTTIPQGATVKLQKDSGDGAAYYNIDFIDLENVAAAIAQPAGSASITSYGAVANDGGDDTAAFNAAVNAVAAGGTVWIPEGTFILNSRPAAFPKNVTIQGAGMWRSVLSGVGASFTPNAKTVKFYDFAISGATTLRDDDQLQSGIDAGGNGFGSGSVIQNIWFSHLKVGIWTGPATPNLTINNCRVWDVFADGINLFNGTSNSVVMNTSVRNTGDDGIAIWSGGGNVCFNNNVHDNLVQFPLHANNIAVYGGYGNIIQNNTVEDTVQYGGGLYVAARFDSVAFSGTTTVSGNTLNRTGSYDPDYGFGSGAVRLEAKDGNMAGTFALDNNTVNDPAYAGVLFVGTNSITGVTFNNLVVTNPATYGVEVRSNARGSASFNAGSYGTITNAAGSNFVITTNGATPSPTPTPTATPRPDLVVTSVTWSPSSPAAGNAVTFNAIIKNQGTAATPSGTIHGVAFQVDGTTVTWSDTYTTSLAIGASVTLTANGGGSGATWAATSGTHTVTAYVDDVNRIVESNEGNNTLSASLTVSGSTGQPDLVVTAITWSPASPSAGSAVSFSATVKNQGTAASPAGVKHGVAFSIDGAQGPWIDNYNTSIAAGASVTITANGGPAGATWSATSGTHTIGALVDDQNLIAESAEGNNSLSTSLTVGSGGGGFPVAGTWYKILNRNSGKALEIGGQTTNDGAGADQWDYVSQTNQKWQFAATDSGYYELIVQNSSKALDVDGASTADGAKVQQWTYGGGTNQQWQVVDLGGGYYKIAARHDGKALGVVSSGTANGNLVSQYSYTGATSQQWSIVVGN